MKKEKNAVKRRYRAISQLLFQVQSIKVFRPVSSRLKVINRCKLSRTSDSESTSLLVKSRSILKNSIDTANICASWKIYKMHLILSTLCNKFQNFLMYLNRRINELISNYCIALKISLPILSITINSVNLLCA